MITIKKGDIVLADLNHNHYNVQCGLRPCLIVQNDVGNTYSPNVIVVPLTTKLKKKEMPVHVILKHGNSFYEMALCESILTISKKQIKNHLRSIDAKDVQRIDEALEVSLGIYRREEY